MNPTINLVLRISQEIFDRAFSGETSYPQDVQRLEQLAELAREYQHEIYSGRLLNLAGIVAGEYGNHADALGYYRRANKIFEAHSSPTNEALVSLNIAVGTQQRIGEYPDSLESLQDAVVTIRKGDNQDRLGTILANLGSTLAQMHRFEEARPHLTQAMEVTLAYNQNQMPVYLLAYVGLAEVALHQGDYPAAWEYVKLASEFAADRLNRRYQSLPMLAKVHIAQQDPNTPQSATVYREQLQQLAADGTRYGKMNLARALVTEGFYQYYGKQYTQARQTATAAAEALRRANLFEEQQAPTYLVKLVDEAERGNP